MFKKNLKMLSFLFQVEKYLIPNPGGLEMVSGHLFASPTTLSTLSLWPSSNHFDFEPGYRDTGSHKLFGCKPRLPSSDPSAREK